MHNGDTGLTDTLQGGRVLKCSDQIELVGQLDELQAYILILCEFIPRVEDDLRKIADELSRLMTAISADLPYVPSLDLFDSYDGFAGFKTPSGIASAYANLARAVCRRAERQAVRCYIYHKCFAPVAYLNRLSSFLYAII